MSTIYETHVTVEFSSLFASALFNHYIYQEVSGAKPLLIELSKGTYPMQLMLAIKKELPDDAIALAWGESLVDQLQGVGYRVVRLKVESPLMAGPSQYFEAHWKFESEVDFFAHDLEDWMKKNPGFLRSRNVFNKQIHYLSQRHYSTSHQSAHDQFIFANRVLSESGLPLTKVHYERVVWDSFSGLDEGWAGEATQEVCTQ